MDGNRQRHSIGDRRGSYLMLVLAFFALGNLAGCAVEKHKNPVITTGVVNIGPADNFPAGAANTNFLSKYGIVVVNDSGTPLAMRPICTYDGSTLKWDAATRQFVCDLHGCHYDLLGRVTKGPATKDLPGVVAERQADGTLTVDLSKLNSANGD